MLDTLNIQLYAAARSPCIDCVASSRPSPLPMQVWKAPRLPHRVELTSQEKKELIALKTENEFLR